MRAALLLPVAAFALTLLAGCGGGSSEAPATVTVTAPPAAAAAPTTSAPAPAQQLQIPDVSGKNGAIALDELERAGFTNVQPASRDEQDKVVINAANWTVTKIEPGVGQTVSSDSPVVVTMTKE